MRLTLGYHAIMSLYGFGLPNAPRGSWSDFVGAWELFRYGGHATKVDTSASLARHPHDRSRRQVVKRHLKYPPVRLAGAQARAVASGFRRASVEGGYAIHACPILPDHVHLVIGRHPRPISQIVAHLKARATQQLIAEGLHPLARFADVNGALPSPWARKYRKVFIDDGSWVRNAIGYVEGNPLKEGKRRQRWKMIVPFVP
jgi:REP element-mobilizing transposase RayT